jgi:hypothetical protein
VVVVAAPVGAAALVVVAAPVVSAALVASVLEGVEEPVLEEEGVAVEAAAASAPAVA